MTPIKRNSEEFKEIKAIFEEYKTSARRIRTIKLYALKPFETAGKKILLTGENETNRVTYSLIYEMLLDYLTYNKTKKLFRNEDLLYYFKSNANTKWMEFPFELSKTLLKRVKPLRIVR